MPAVRARLKEPATKTRFTELLGDLTASGGGGGGGGGTSQLSREAFEADLKLQRRMERKLGLKKDTSKTGMDDMLDGLLEGITAGNELLPAFMSGSNVRKGAAVASGGGGVAGTAAKAGGARGADDGGDSGSASDDGSLSGSEGESDEEDGGSGSDGSESEDNGGSSDSEGDAGMAGLIGSDDDGASGDASGDDDGEGGSSSGEDEGSEEGEGEGSEDDDGLYGSDDGGLYSSDGGSGSGSGDEGEGESEEEDGRAARARGGGDASTSAPSSTAAGAAAAAGGKYVPPAARARLAAEAAAVSGGGSGSGGGSVAGVRDAASSAVARRVTGLVNRLAEANLQGIVKDIAGLYASEGRRAVCDAVTHEVLSAASEGPRATEQFAATAAAFIAGCAGACKSPELSAGFIAGLADRLEAAYIARDSLAMGNLTRLLAHAYAVSLVRSEVLYSFLSHVRARMAEPDVDMIVALLGSVGLQLRSEDPAAMRDFVLSVHARAAEVGSKGGLTQRAQMMLDLVVDIKNNRKDRAAGSSGGKRAAAALTPAIFKWLRTTGVEDVQLKNIGWDKLTDSSRRKGMWWLPAAGESAPLAARLGGGSLVVDGTPDEETTSLLRMAAAQRMNTNARRAVFVAIMGSDDCVEAHEKLLRLPLKGEQEREVVRVLMHCALAESSWNPYYGLLALKLCKSSKGHRMTLQFALWDAFKDLSSYSAAQLVTTARLAGLCVAKSALPLAMLKVVELGELDARGTFFWRLFFRFTLAGCKDGGDVQEVFLRLTQQRKTHAPIIAAMLTFVRGSVGPWLASQTAGGSSEGGGAATAGGALSQGQLDELLRRVRMAERVLSGGR